MFSTTIVLLSTFVLGFLSGVMTLGGYALYRLKKFDRERLKFAKELAKTAKDLAAKAESAKERINKAFDICERQFEILSGMEGPQSGPLHGKHKQQMNAELKRLEEEKMTLLKSVLADGYDPKLVTITETGEKEAVRLSEFIRRRDLMSQENGRRGVPSPPEKPKRLTLVKNNDKEETK